MKGLKAPYLFIIFAAVFTYSCEEKGEIEPNKEPAPKEEVPEYIRSDTLVIGDTRNTLYTDFNSLLIKAEVNTIESYEIDIDDDGRNDLNFTVYFTVSPGGNGGLSSEIICLDSTISLSVYETIDTSYYHTRIDTFYENNRVHIVFYRLWTCRRLDYSDKITKIINVHKLNLHEDGDTLSLENLCVSNRFRLWLSSSEGMMPNLISETWDTVKVEYIYGIGNCDNFPNRPVYLGIKQQKNAVTKLGWIKFKVESGNEIILYQSAIQK